MTTVTRGSAVSSIEIFNNTLYSDPTNNRIGIGLSAPSCKLDIVGTDTVDGQANVVARFRTSATSTSDSGILIGSVNGNTPFIGIDDGGNSNVGLSLYFNAGKRYDFGYSGEFIIYAASTESSSIELGKGRSGNGNTYIDFTGDATYTDYGLRIIRGNSGANASSQIIHRGTGDLKLVGAEACAFRLSTSNTERLTVLSTGEVGINKASPVAALDVYSALSDTWVAEFFNDGDGSTSSAGNFGIKIRAGADDASGNTTYIECFRGDNQSIGYIWNTSGTFQLVDSSDARLKKDIANTKVKGLDTIKKLKVREFIKIGSNGFTSAGFVAQECLEAFPEMVAQRNDADYLGISKEALVPVLVKALQESSDIIENLSVELGNTRKAVIALEARIEKLEKK